MPIDSVNVGRELKNLRAEIADLRTEVAFMYSAFQSIQEQFGFALAEIANLIKNLQPENYAEQNFSLLREEMTVLEKHFNRKITENISATDSVNENFSRIEKNFNALQSTLLEKVSGVGENVSVVQKNLAKFSSEVDEILADNQKSLLKKIDSANNNPKDFLKTLNAIEEMLRLIAANQLLNEVQNNLPQKKSPPNVSAGRKKKIFICGQFKVGKTTLADTLKLRIQNLDITEVSIDKNDVLPSFNADLVIFVLDEKVLTYYTQQRFYELLIGNRKILVVVNPTEKFPSNKDNEIFENFKSGVRSYFPTMPSDWNKISVVYVYLKGAQRGWNDGNINLFKKSNFEAIENFINTL